jgi:drug/metabolite transporter (DMT)-like permease
MIFGLAAAFAWGSADFEVALVSRKIGSFTTLVLAQLAGIVFFSALLATPVGSFPRFHPGLLILPVVGVSGALSYLAFYRALELGPIALVSPIAAGYAAIVIALSLIFLQEDVAPMALAGAAVTIGGVVLASTDLRGLSVERNGPSAQSVPARSGVFFAILAMVGFGVASFLIGMFAQDTGWFTTIYLSRVGSAATLAAILVVTGARGLRTAELRRVLLAFAIGVLDIGGFALYARGAEVGRVSITAAASVIYPLIPILVGVAYLRERPAVTQWVGVAAVGVGLILLALGR